MIEYYRDRKEGWKKCRCGNKKWFRSKECKSCVGTKKYGKLSHSKSKKQTETIINYVL